MIQVTRARECLFRPDAGINLAIQPDVTCRRGRGGNP